MEKISLTQIGLYNPRRQNSELTEKLFVIRQKQFEMLMEAIADEENNSIPQHHIIIAQRGMGKTTMLHRIKIELQKKKYNKRFIPLAFPEEQSTVNSLVEFWLNCLDALADALEYENCDKTKIEYIDNQIKEFELNKKQEETAAKSYKFLKETCRKIKRRPVLLIDNIGLLFNRLERKEQHILRALLSENGAPIVMGAGVVVLPSQSNDKADILKNVTDYEAPFYDYFQIHYLKKLSFEEFQTLILNLSKVTQTDIAIINENTPRLRTIHQLTGGNPRTAVMLFKLIVKGFSREINDDLEALLDEITPLYKARYEELSEQSQTIIASIALNWEPVCLRLLSQQSGYANNQLSPQLKRLTEEGWIETTPAEKAKGNAYSISERFFNIWFLMRMSTRRHKQAVNLLTKFLESFYGSDLKIIARNYLNKNYQRENDVMSGMIVKDSFGNYDYFLQEALLELHNRNEGIAKGFLSDALRYIKNELPKETMDSWYHFAAKCLNLNYAKWFLEILKEKGFDKILSPYYVAVQALEIEQRENKEKSEIYLKNRAVEISEPARIIIERILSKY